jgi:carbamoyltransferase
MSKILGVNLSHNCSFAYLKDGVLKEYYEEDRFNKIKHFHPYHPFQKDDYQYLALKKFNNILFDEVSFVSNDRRGDAIIEKHMIENILKQVEFKKFKFYFGEHHLLHALCGFYFSDFNEALILVCDGGGEFLNGYVEYGFEALESVYHINNDSLKCFYQHYSNARTDFFKKSKYVPSETHWKNKNTDVRVSNIVCCGVKYYDYMIEAGFPAHSEGQLMGMAAYKNKDTDIDKHALECADKAQTESLEERIEFIKKAKTYSDCKNIILSGGYHLNCANNFKLVKLFPELNFFVDPIAHDGGTAVGAAYATYQYEKDFKN